MKSVMMRFIAGVCLAGGLWATETENLNIRVLPAPGGLKIDGTAEGWDLSGGVFVCGDVETQRDKIAVWIHAMWDKDNLYVLARFKDETPLSNPGTVAGDPGWGGDALQMRIVADPERQEAPVCWVTAWRDRDGKDVIDIDFPNKNGEALKDAKAKGAKQAFTVDADGKGYVQEIALPWKVLREGGLAAQAGMKILFSVEPNFNTAAGYRISLKDIFRPGVTVDRVFTFHARGVWGFATLADKGGVEPQPLRLADNREFKVSMEGGAPVIDWTGLLDAKGAREGFTDITFEAPEDGYVSLNIRDAEGYVVRQLVNGEFYAKGKHTVPWDGLTNMSHLKPGEPVPEGAYTWEAIFHTGIGLRLVGWADNAGRTPYDSPGGNWGGDMGNPSALATDGESMYLGWNCSEAGKALVCADFEGNVKWRHKRGGFGGAAHVALDNGMAYVYDWQDDGVIYRISTAKSDYINFEGSSLATVTVGKGLVGLDAYDGNLYLAQSNTVRVLSAKTGKQAKSIPVRDIINLTVAPDGTLYALANDEMRLETKKGVTTFQEFKASVLEVKPDGTTAVRIEGIINATCLTVDAEGNFYVGVRDPDNQVKVFNKDGKAKRAIGKKGGRPLFGPWKKDGMRFIAAVRLDKHGTLWVAEQDDHPKRFSCWDAATGTFIREFFGPTHYGAPGGAISPADPLVMAGSGCEWKLDKATGRAVCVGVFHRGECGTCRFSRGDNGRLYVAVSGDYHGYQPVYIYERLAPGDYRLRARLDALADKIGGNGHPNGKISGIRIWSDANGDGIEQPGEVTEQMVELGGWVSGWYMPMTPGLTFYGGLYRIAPTGWTKCGAPRYDLTKATRLPAPEDIERRGGMGAQRGIGSADGSLVLYNGHYGVNHSDFPCYDIASGKLKWTYPNNYVGVHGGHNAPPAQPGMINAAYDIVGVGKLPAPIGNFFVIATDKGMWHILTEGGFYLTQLFESDAAKISFPEAAVPGAVTDNIPPGMGAEDFGGSVTIADDGHLYLQAGKTAYVNHRVTGLDTVKALPGGTLTLTAQDLPRVMEIRDKLAQAGVGARLATAKKHSVTNFTGDIRRDFNVRELMKFEKKPTDRVEFAIGYDDAMLYLGWKVTDATPWATNGASEAAEMYSRGDTVDFQLGTDASADRKRTAPVLGDLRISIGNLKGTPAAVLFKPVSDEKRPRKFYSGVIRDGYEMQCVKTLDNAKIEVKATPGREYTVEAAIPLKDIGFTPAPGTTYTGDIGATFGDPEGAKTILRSHWSNQATGIVADDVFELKLEPKNWGQILFE